MTERLHPVRLVHQHLRRAASLLEQRQVDAATAEVEAALAIDPASLTARALQEKIRAARCAPAPPSDLVGGLALRAEMPETETAERFIPSGVDAQSWLGFEHRIQARRFAALLDTIAAALREGDLVGARLALEEARELRPDAPELDTAEDQLAMLPVLVPVAQQRSRVGTRALGAVALLSCGVALLLGLDAMRPDERPLPEPDVVVHQPPRADIAAPKAAEAPIPVLTPPTEEGGAVGTVGVQPALAIAPTVHYQAPVLRPATLVERVLPPVGEIPDDYVAPAAIPVMRDVTPPPAAPLRPPTPQPREATPGPGATTLAAATTPVLPPSASSAPVITGGSAPPAASVAAAPAPVAATRVDEQGVSQALNQYARAYGRLDAVAARAVWPSVDERALARAFAGLESQNLSFDRCDIDVRGATANASCRGQASYVGKVGAREPRTEPRQWRFELRRDGEAWKIESAEARRVSSY